MLSSLRRISQASTGCSRIIFRAPHHTLRTSVQISSKITYTTMSTDTSSYKFNHSMLRVKDPKRSVHFYQDILGMKQINKISNPDAKFDLYFLAYDWPQSVSLDKHWTGREGIIEL